VLLQRCLQKDPKQRLRDIGDARISLEEVLSGAPEAPLTGAPQAVVPLTRLTFEGTNNNVPVWTPDGKRIALNSNRDGQLKIFWQLADGSGGLERLTTSEFLHAPMSFSPDGQLLAFNEITPTTGSDIFVLRLPRHTVQRAGAKILCRRTLAGLQLERIGSL